MLHIYARARGQEETHLLSTGHRTTEGRDRAAAATKKAWAEHREERRASISAGMRRYWKRRRKELGWDRSIVNNRYNE
jgi:hypothetical protein